MVSQSEKRAWANLGPALGQAFQNYGRQRQDLATFKAQMALREKENAAEQERYDEETKYRKERDELTDQLAAAELQKEEARLAGYDEALSAVLGATTTGQIDPMAQINPRAALEYAPEDIKGASDRLSRMGQMGGGKMQILAALAGSALEAGGAAAAKPEIMKGTKAELPEGYSAWDIMTTTAPALSTEGKRAMYEMPLDKFVKPGADYAALGNELNFAMAAKTPYEQLSPALKGKMPPEAYQEQQEYTQLIQEYGLEGTRIDFEIKGKQSALLTMQMEQTGPFKPRPVGVSTAPKATQYESPLDALGDMTPTDKFNFIFEKKKDWKQLKGEGEPKFDTLGDPIMKDGVQVMDYSMKWVQEETDEYVNNSPQAKEIRAYYLGDPKAAILEAAEVGMTAEEIAESLEVSLEEVEAVLGTTETETE